MASKRTTGQESFVKMLNQVIDGIDAGESTEWEQKTEEVSANIRKALIGQMNALRTACDQKFLDYCNTVKALLAIYNFGNLDIDEDDENVDEPDWLKADKALIIEGVSAILEHVATYGYDITPYISEAESKNIFGEGKAVRLTMSAATVFTTLVYFRRAYKRNNLFTEEELMQADNLMEKVKNAVSEILVLFVKYIETHKYTGWGFSFDSAAVTLSDTYAVVDAISRFADAFTKDDELKKDQEFIDEVNSYAREALGEDFIVDRCLNSMYKAAFNVYDRTKEIYGRSIFYAGATRGADGLPKYVYSQTDYDQISNSNRSSALFNPLYVAMITMYGYNEKEIVIRKFMDDYKLAAEIYKTYQTDMSENRVPGKMTISEYAAKLNGFGDNGGLDFEEEAALLREEQHEKVSNDYSDNDKWRRYYRIARVFQKYLETQEPDRLMKIAEYRDYLNATKDAIDQVQIMYRNFDNNQRLGIVDTDYVMFSTLDIDTDLVNISKLNKANIAVNNLRPMLLSSKIMIVNALTKYPQSDLEELYNSIIDAQYQRSVGKDEKIREWLWNADSVDMNSTARHCEAITYDYFDYYERYELGLKAINSLKSNIGSDVTQALDKTGTFSVEKAMGSESMVSFKRVVLAITHQNVERIKSKYQSDLREKDSDHAKEIAELQKQIEQLEKDKADLIESNEKDKNKLEEEHLKALAALEESRRIGDTMRTWIREEIERYLTETLSMIVLNKLNGNHRSYKRDTFSLETLMEKYNSHFVDAEIEPVRTYGEKLRAAYDKNSAAATEEFEPKFKHVLAMQELLDAAFDGIFDLDSVVNRKIDENNCDAEKANPMIRKAYRDRKHDRAVEKEYARFSAPVQKDDAPKD